MEILSYNLVGICLGIIIAAIFVGYTSVETKSGIDLYLIFIGFLFSLAWLLVIKGNRAWQLNAVLCMTVKANMTKLSRQ
jgi:hypothetical protein